jgi:peroxiredoxin-like protein
MEVNHLYEVNLKWIADRKGVISSPVLPGNIEVATPPEFPKGIPGIWSPEHLYVGAVVSCFMTTFLAIAENSKLEFSAFSCDAKGTLAKVDGKFQMTEITLYPSVVLLNEEQAEKTKRVMDMSERNCLISNSIKTTVRLESEIKLAKIIAV